MIEIEKLHIGKRDVHDPRVNKINELIDAVNDLKSIQYNHTILIKQSIEPELETISEILDLVESRLSAVEKWQNEAFAHARDIEKPEIGCGCECHDNGTCTACNGNHNETQPKNHGHYGSMYDLIIGGVENYNVPLCRCGAIRINDQWYIKDQS